MPGRNPAEAIRNYIDPIQRAISCLRGQGNICITNRPHAVGQFGAWSLNAPDQGMTLPRFGRFFAQQRFELVQTTDKYHVDPDREPFRVSTREYLYRLCVNETEDHGAYDIKWHWHPEGNSDERRPHIHPAVNPKAHLPCPRIAIEEVIEGCIELGAQTSCDDWKERLLESCSIHKLYRSWSNDPDE